MNITYNGKEYSFKDNILSYSNTVLGVFQSQEEAITYLEAGVISESVYKKLNADSIALSLYENGESRVTETLIENVKKIIEEKLFYPSNSILELRLKYDDFPVEGKIEYKLLDNSKILLDIETNRFINKHIDIRENRDLVTFMNKNSSNFYSILESLLEENYGN